MALLSLTGFTPTHDPTIVKENGVYYRFQTGPGIPVSKSNDLHHWEFVGKVFDTNPKWTKTEVPGSTDFWAPEVVYRDGKWRIYYAVSTFGSRHSSIGMAETVTLDRKSANYGWTDKGSILHTLADSPYNAIDPAVIMDTDGKDWMLFGSFWMGLGMFPLTKDGFRVKDSEIINVANRQTDPDPVEGGYILYKDGWYYLFASYDFCCRGSASTYHIVVGRSKNVTGPYEDDIGQDFMHSGGLKLRDGFSHKRWAGPGHNSVFVDDDGKTYIVYHAYDRENEGRPELQIEELKWKDGWPYLE